MLEARDPVELGIVATLARPGASIAGIAATVGPSIAGKRLALLKEALPHASRVADLWNSTFPGNVARLLSIAGTSSPIPIFPGYSHIDSQRILSYRTLRENIGVRVGPAR